MGFISKPIFSRLASRFQIRQAASEQLESGQVLVPTTNVDELLRVNQSKIDTGTATDLDSSWTVPSGKLWRIWAWGCDRDQAGTAKVWLECQTNYVKWIAVSASATAHGGILNGLPLREGDVINISAGTGTSGDISNSIFYTEEDA